MVGGAAAHPVTSPSPRPLSESGRRWSNYSSSPHRPVERPIPIDFCDSLEYTIVSMGYNAIGKVLCLTRAR